MVAVLRCRLNAPTWVTPIFGSVMPDVNSAEALFTRASLRFAPGLSGLSYFETLRSPFPCGLWAVYVMVYKKPGFKSLMYIGYCGWGCGRTDGKVEKGRLAQSCNGCWRSLQDSS